MRLRLSLVILFVLSLAASACSKHPEETSASPTVSPTAVEQQQGTLTSSTPAEPAGELDDNAPAASAESGACCGGQCSPGCCGGTCDPSQCGSGSCGQCAQASCGGGSCGGSAGAPELAAAPGSPR